MKSRTRIVALSLACVGAFAMGGAFGDTGHNAGTEVLQKSGCNGCHAPDKKKVGPAYNDIAAKYKGQADAVDKLAAEVAAGKPHPKVKAQEAEIKQAVAAILAK